VIWLVAAIGWLGWALFVAAALTLRRRMALLADAEHELRGAATAIGLARARPPRLSCRRAGWRRCWPT
jgi:hypothetical protein